MIILYYDNINNCAVFYNSIKSLGEIDMENFKKELETIINAIPGNKGVFVKDCSTSKWIGFNEKRKFHAASVIKVPIMYEALLQVQTGKLNLNDTFILENEEKVGGSGVLQLMHDKLKLTLKDIIALMIDVSDNTATNMLHDILGKDNINNSINELGLKDTYFARKLMKVVPGLYSYTAAYDIGILLEEFLNCNYLSEEMAQEGMEIMYNQQYNDRLSAKLIECGHCGKYLGNLNICPNCNSNTDDVDPKLVPFAHKTGSINGVVHDAGILTVNDKKIIVVCLTDNLQNDEEGVTMQQQLGLSIYRYFKQ